MTVDVKDFGGVLEPWPDGALWVDRLFGDGGPVAVGWGKCPLLLRQIGTPEVLPAIEELLSTPLLRPPYMTVLVDGAVLPSARFCRSEHVINTSKPDLVVDQDLLTPLLESGAAVKFNRMELWSPPIRALAEKVSAACGKRVKVWGFLSPHGQSVVPAHRDPAHVLALQLKGTKQWILGGPCPAGRWSAMDRLTVDEPEPLALEPGDVLYLPYGYAHYAAAETTSSFHVSFALEGTTAGGMRQLLLRAVSERVDGFDATELREDDMERIVAELRQAVDEVLDRGPETGAVQ